MKATVVQASGPQRSGARYAGDPLVAGGFGASLKNQALNRNTVDNTHIIGWREWVSLPGLGIEAVEAKMDTGARTSCMHAADFEAFRQDDQDWLRFTAILGPDESVPDCTAPLVGERWVRSSNGEASLRPVVQTSLCLGDQVLEVDITLAKRDAMEYRLIVGRGALRNRFLIDPARKHLLGSVPTLDAIVEPGVVWA